MSRTDFVERLRSYDTQVGVRRKLQREFPASYVPCPACADEERRTWCPTCRSTRRVTRGTVKRWRSPAL